MSGKLPAAEVDRYLRFAGSSQVHYYGVAALSTRLRKVRSTRCPYWANPYEVREQLINGTPAARGSTRAAGGVSHLLD